MVLLMIIQNHKNTVKDSICNIENDSKCCKEKEKCKDFKMWIW